MSSAETLVLDYVLNSAWQVPLLFAAGWIASRSLRRLGPRAEHWMWVGTLAAATVVPACDPGALRIAVGWIRRMWGRGGGMAQGGVATRFGVGTVDAAGALRVSPVIGRAMVAVYLLVLLYGCGRLLWRIGRGFRLRRDALPTRLTGDSERSWERCCRRFGVMDAELASSAEVAGPVTLGMGKRMLLAPFGFLEAAEPGDRDAALAHEFAHMQRRDFAKNLLYEALSLPIGFHPFAALIKSQVAQSRELLCDELAAEATGLHREYAKSLLRLAAMISSGSPAGNLHAIGIFDANILERRVMNLTVRRKELKGTARLAAVVACGLLAVAACGTAMALRMEVKAATATATKRADSQAPAKHAEVPPGEMAGQLISRVVPVYPAKAKADKDTVDGSVVIGVTVDKDGVPTDLHITKSLRADYDESALTSVKTWRYKPYLLNGEPVAVETSITITYSTAH